MSPYETDPRVDDFIGRLPDWQQEICRQVRDLAHAADPAITETIKRTVQPYFVSPLPASGRKSGGSAPTGNVCALLATKDHVNVFLYDGGLTPDPAGLITGGQGNQTGRTISIYRDEPINAPALTAMLRHIAEINRAGGWRKIKQANESQR